MKKKVTQSVDVINQKINNKSVELIPLIELTLKNAALYDNYLKKFRIEGDESVLNLNLTTIQNYDTYLILFVNSLKEIANRENYTFEIIGLTEKTKKFLETFSISPESIVIADHLSFTRRFFNYIGEEAKSFFNDVISFIEFFGQIFAALLNLLINPSKMRWKDFPFHFTRAGVNAVFICLLIMALLGLITGYQGAVQLKHFGADIFVADLVGISIARELSPLMIAILVAGRSGSAFAAEIGTMKVSEEIDALKSMGFDYIQFLVLPRVLSVAIAMPILTLLGDFAGIGGGIIASLATLDISLSGFLNELQRALTFGDLFSGLGKSIIFGFLIASVGCFRGLQVKGGAESVGKYTTISVVTGILMIILADAVFTFLFQAIGI